MYVRSLAELTKEHGVIGIPHEDVRAGFRFPPEGWRLHWSTNYWLPPTYVEHPYGEENQHTIH